MPSTWSKNPADPAMANDAGVKTYLSQVTTADKDNAITVSGWLTADLTINTLLQAAEVPRRTDPEERDPGGPRPELREPDADQRRHLAEHPDGR